MVKQFAPEVIGDDLILRTMQEKFWQLKVRNFLYSIQPGPKCPAKGNERKNFSRHIRGRGEYRLKDQAACRIVHCGLNRANATQGTPEKKQGLNGHPIHRKNLVISRLRIHIDSLLIRFAFTASVAPVIENKNVQVERCQALDIIQPVTEVTGVAMKP